MDEKEKRRLKVLIGTFLFMMLYYIIIILLKYPMRGIYTVLFFLPILMSVILLGVLIYTKYNEKEEKKMKTTIEKMLEEEDDEEDNFEEELSKPLENLNPESIKEVANIPTATKQ